MANSLPEHFTKTLDNGMQIVVIPMDNDSGVITTDIYYKVGSRNEVMGKSGMAHMLEHLSFKSTDKLKEGEYDTMHIEDAVHIPVSAIQSRLDEVPDDVLVVVYCDGSSCNRSSNAASILVENGYSQVFNMGGNGIHEWVEKGYPKVENIK